MAASTSTSTSTKKKPAAKVSVPKGKPSADAPKKGTKKKAGSEASKKVLVIVESPAKARTISQLLKKAGGGRFDGYTVDACNGHVTDLVGKRKDVPLELKEKTKKWDVVGVDVVRVSRTLVAKRNDGFDNQKKNPKRFLFFGTEWIVFLTFS